MGDNLVRRGDDKPKSVKMDAYDRAKRLEGVNIELPMALGEIIDELLDRAEQLQEAQRHFGPDIRKDRDKLRDKENALGLDDI